MEKSEIFIFFFFKLGVFKIGASQKFKIPYIPNVSVGWDPSPRAAQSDIYENTGYPFTPIFSSNKTEFKNALQLSKQYLDSKCE